MTHAAQILKSLQSSVLGRELSTDHLQALQTLAVCENHSVGTALFQEGLPADSLFILDSGRVGLDIRVPLRGAVRIQTVGAGDLLGWSPLVGDGHMTATATVLDAAAVLKIPGPQLKSACIRDPLLGYAVMHRIALALARRLHGTRLQMLDLFAEGRSQPPSFSANADRASTETGAQAEHTQKGTAMDAAAPEHAQQEFQK